MGDWPHWSTGSALRQRRYWVAGGRVELAQPRLPALDPVSSSQKNNE